MPTSSTAQCHFPEILVASSSQRYYFNLRKAKTWESFFRTDSTVNPLNPIGSEKTQTAMRCTGHKMEKIARKSELQELRLHHKSTKVRVEKWEYYIYIKKYEK